MEKLHRDRANKRWRHKQDYRGISRVSLSSPRSGRHEYGRHVYGVSAEYDGTGGDGVRSSWVYDVPRCGFQALERVALDEGLGGYPAFRCIQVLLYSIFISDSRILPLAFAVQAICLCGCCVDRAFLS